MLMANAEPSMDILDGSDVDEDNVGDIVDVDQENVLLESDDEEAHPSHQLGKLGVKERLGRKITREEEEEDVLNILPGDEEEIELDYDGDLNEDDGVNQRLPPVKVRSSLVSNNVAAGPSFEGDSNREAGASVSFAVPEGVDAGEEHFEERRYVVEDEDDYEEDEDTGRRSRFTSERNLDNCSRSSGSSGHSGTNTIQTIQTVGGEHKLRLGLPDNRPRHWNHNNGPRQGGPRPNGPRYPMGRNQRFPPPRQVSPGDHMRPMLNPQVVQFNDGIFTDFNQPLRHPYHPGGPRPRPLGPPGQHNMPRHPDPNMHRHPNPVPNQMRPGFPPPHQVPQQQSPRPFFPPQQEGQMGQPPRPPQPGPPGINMHPPVPGQQPQPPRLQPPTDFNMRPGAPRPPRFPPNQNSMHPNQRSPMRPPPPNGGQPPNMLRPPFPPRQQRPPFRPDMSHDPMGMPPQRYPPQPGYPPHQQPPPPHGYPPNHMHPPHGQPHPPPRFMGPHGGPPGGHDGSHNAYYGGHPNYNHPPGTESGAYPPEQHWHGQSEHGPPQGGPPHQWPHQSPHPHQQQQLPSHQTNYNGLPAGHYNHQNAVYDQNQPRPSSLQVNAASLPLAALQGSLDIPQITGKSIYIKPNSEIFDALTKGGHFAHLKEEDRRHGESSSRPAGEHGSSSERERSSSNKHYDDYDDHHHHHYHDRERERDRERRRSPDRRRDRDEDDYYDDRRRHHYDDRDRDRDRDRRPRRKYEEESRDRRHRSDSPEKKMTRSDNYDRERERGRDRDREPPKETDTKLLEEAKSLGLGEDYVKKLEEQRLLREKILKTKEARRKQVKGPGESSSDLKALKVPSKVQKDADSSTPSKSGSSPGSSSGGVTRKVLRIVKDKSGKIISKKVHVVVVGKHQDAQQSTSSS